MTTIKTEINGQPFEITIPDGCDVEFSDGAIKVSRATYQYQHQNPLAAALQPGVLNGTVWINPHQNIY
jgi:hypothetical protein